MKQQSFHKNCVSKVEDDVRREQQFTESLYALSAILHEVRDVPRRQTRSRGEDPRFRSDAA